jgi:hypothetical protein
MKHLVNKKIQFFFIYILYNTDQLLKNIEYIFIHKIKYVLKILNIYLLI